MNTVEVSSKERVVLFCLFCFCLRDLGKKSFMRNKNIHLNLEERVRAFHRSRDKEISQMSYKGSNSKVCFPGMISSPTQLGLWVHAGENSQATEFEDSLGSHCGHQTPFGHYPRPRIKPIQGTCVFMSCKTTQSTGNGQLMQ